MRQINAGDPAAANVGSVCELSQHGAASEVGASALMLRAIESHVHSNISSPTLSAASTARSLNISPRYVHKLLAIVGVRFSAYVTNRRLASVCGDLLALGVAPRGSISTLAFRWGFRDLSTFNRAFRHRYGMSPSAFRLRASEGGFEMRDAVRPTGNIRPLYKGLLCGSIKCSITDRQSA